MEEVVITGVGVVSCLGNTPEELWNNALAGKSGISNIVRFDTEKFSVKFAGEVKEFDSTPYFTPRDAKRTSRNIQYGVHTAETALQMAGLAKDSVEKSRAGVIYGSGMGGMEVFAESAVNCENKGPRRISPFFIPMAISNMAAGEIAIRLGWMGINYSISSACATSNHCVMAAADQIRLGRADVMLAGGTEEAVSEIGLGGFASMKALSTRNEAPSKASRPFDKDRDGFVLGEGAGCVVLESRKHAEARGAKILAVLKGYGASCDAYHMSAPKEDGEGVRQCIDAAAKDAGIKVTDIGYVNCHGTSTPLGDVAEVKAIKKAFDNNTQDLKINSTKSMTGHPLGAASAVELCITLKSLMEQKLHPTINVENQDEEIDLDVCANGAVEHKFDFAMSNSFGFGGHNSALILGKA